MPVAADPITHRKLALVRQLYQHGTVQALHHASMSRIISLISFDLASESLLRTLVACLEPSKTPNDAFQGLMAQAESLLQSAGLPPLPDKANIQHVHSIRNDAQHKAKYPSDTDIVDARVYTRDFLVKTIDNVWGLNFDGISQVDLIQSPDLKGFLTNAEKALEQNNYDEAGQEAAKAVALALSRVKAAIVGREPRVEEPPMVDPFGEPDHFAAHLAADELKRTLERMQQTLLYIALGLSYADYMKFRQVTGSMVVMGNTFQAFLETGLTASEAEFAVAFATDTVFRIEASVGDVEKPFGSDYWY